MPAGALLAIARFRGRRALILIINTLMGLPPVLVGLIVYLMISRSGPLGVLELLYTPTAMIIAQTILVTPIIVSLTRQTVKDLLVEYDAFLRMHGLTLTQRVGVFLYEGRLSLATAVLAGTGRAIAEVGAVMIVGGNINHVTRTMTTAIALETSKGNLDLAIALGVVLLLIALTINAALLLLRPREGPRLRRRWGY
jgi:tungstate transport system permease protein